MKKTLLVVLALMLAIALVACTPADEPTDPVVPVVSITVDAASAGQSAEALINAYLDAEAIAYVNNGNFYETIGDFANAEPMAWMFYVNGVLSDIGVADAVAAEGDVLEMRWEDTSAYVTDNADPVDPDAVDPAADPDAVDPAADPDAVDPAADPAVDPAAE